MKPYLWKISVALKFIETRDLAEYILIRKNKLKTKLDSVKYLLKKKCLPLKRCIQLSLRSSLPEVFYKKGVLKNFAKFTGKQLCQSLFSCEFGEISEITLSYRTPTVAASVACHCRYLPT